MASLHFLSYFVCEYNGFNMRNGNCMIILYHECLSSNHTAFISQSFDLSAMGRTAEILNRLAFMPSATDIIFELTITTVNGPSYLAKCPVNTLTRSPERIRYLASSVSVDFNALLILIRLIQFPFQLSLVLQFRIFFLFHACFGCS